MFADITIHSTAEEKSPQKVDKTAVKKLANAQLHADKKLKRAAEKEIRQNDGKGQNRWAIFICLALFVSTLV